MHQQEQDQALQRQSVHLPGGRSEAERRAAYDSWLHSYNHHRGHTALKGLSPASRVTNLSGQNT